MIGQRLVALGVVSLLGCLGIVCRAGAADFQTRCANASVIRCVDFDTPATIAGGYGSNFGIFAGDATPEIDTTIKASGAGSLKFTIPANSRADSSGSFFANFSSDLSVLFGGNSQFFIQWRQRFSPELLATTYQGGEGWKQAIITTGDVPGGPFRASCMATTIVTQNVYHRGFAEMYNSCTGSSSHGPYNPFEETFNNDIKLQNARPAPYCLYSQSLTKPRTFFPPAGNCFGYFANEWMTFQIEVDVGPRVDDEFKNSHVKLWIAREGHPSELVFDWGPYNLTAGAPADNEEFGKVWLLPYNTNKDPSATYPVAYTWYDELIISRAKIADPDGGSNNASIPNPPTNVAAR
jgi:hypothetical protein